MADGATFDFDDVMKLAADIGEVAADGEKPVKTAVHVTSMKIKKSAQAKVGRRKQLSQAAGGITFDVTVKAGGIESEIGYDKDRGGVAHLGNLVEYGAPNAKAYKLVRVGSELVPIVDKSAPARPLTPGNELQRSLAEEKEDFVRGIEIALDDVMKAKGL